jgi:hypothetical protein
MAMHLNDDLLLRFGFWVPSNFTSFGSHDFKHLAIAGRTIEGNLSPIFYAAEEHDSAKVDSILRFIFNTQHNNILLSSELVFYYPNFLSSVVNVAQMHGFEVHLIAYLERQDRALIKGYLQNIRNHRFHGTLVDFVAATRRMLYFEYHTILTKIKETCRTAKLSIRTFDREFLKENDILSDFINTVNSAIPAGDFVRPTGTVNASLRLEETEMVRS